MLLGEPEHLLRLLGHFNNKFFKRSERHAFGKAMVNARWLLPSDNALLAQVAQIGWNGNLVPVKARPHVVVTAFLPGAVIYHTNALLAHEIPVLLLARNRA